MTAVGVDFEARYRADSDPWDYATSEYEQAKYAATLQACGPGPFAHALELGGSIGVFSALLAPRCERLDTLDAAPTAVAAARERLAQHPAAHARLGLDPGPICRRVRSISSLPPRSCTTSTAERLAHTLLRLADELAPGGRVVAVHWRPDRSGASAERRARAPAAAIAAVARAAGRAARARLPARRARTATRGVVSRDVDAIVVVPARDEAERHRPCLHALAGQRLGHGVSFAVVVVLDECHDETGTVATEAAAALGLELELIAGPGRGAGAARRVGMERAAARPARCRTLRWTDRVDRCRHATRRGLARPSARAPARRRARDRRLDRSRPGRAGGTARRCAGPSSGAGRDATRARARNRAGCRTSPLRGRLARRSRRRLRGGRRDRPARGARGRGVRRSPARARRPDRPAVGCSCAHLGAPRADGASAGSLSISTSPLGPSGAATTPRDFDLATLAAP